MTRLRVHVLYERGWDPRPHGSSYLRLLRPLGHPSVADTVEMTYGTDYFGHPADVVIVDRLWRPDLTVAHVEHLLEQLDRAGAALIYALDDNFLQLDLLGQATWEDRLAHAVELRSAVELLLSQARGVLVTSVELQEQLESYNDAIAVLPHALDERLLAAMPGVPRYSPFAKRRTVIGYMGTATHDDDLLPVLPALRMVHEKHRDQVEFEFIGGIGRESTWEACGDLPIRVLGSADENEYPSFMLWFTSRARWDIAIAPLLDTPFNRCKSDVKLLDYGAIGTVGVYSRIPAYESSVSDRVNGVVVGPDAKAWFAAIEELVLDRGMCERMGRAAADLVYSSRTLASCAGLWPRAIESLLAVRESRRQAAA